MSQTIAQHIGIDALADLKVNDPQAFARVSNLVADYAAMTRAQYRAAQAAIVADDARARSSKRGASEVAVDGVVGLMPHARLSSGLANVTVPRFVPAMVGGNVADATLGNASAWEAIAMITDGSRFAAMSRDILTRAAIRKGRRSPDGHAHADVMQDTRTRAYDAVVATLAREDVYPVAGTTSTDDTGTVTPSVDGIVGWYVIRAARCMTCESCQRMTADVSRYMVKSCAAPREIAEYVDVRRIVSRACYAASAADLTSEQYASAADAETLDANAAVIESEHDVTGAHARIRLVAQACALAGVPVTASGSSGLSVAASNMLAASYGMVPNKVNRALAHGKLRAEAGLVN